MTSVFSPVQDGGVGPVVHLAGQKKRMPPQAAAHGRLQGLLGNIREGVRGQTRMLRKAVRPISYRMCLDLNYFMGIIF